MLISACQSPFPSLLESPTHPISVIPWAIFSACPKSRLGQEQALQITPCVVSITSPWHRGQRGWFGQVLPRGKSLLPLVRDRQQLGQGKQKGENVPQSISFDLLQGEGEFTECVQTKGVIHKPRSAFQVLRGARVQPLWLLPFGAVTGSSCGNKN